MASLRAIESGHSIIRSTQAGLSALITPYGTFTASRSSFTDSPRILLSDLPVEGKKTIYSLVGDLWVYLGMLAVLLIAFLDKENKQVDTE